MASKYEILEAHFNGLKEIIESMHEDPKDPLDAGLKDDILERLASLENDVVDLKE